MATFTLLVFLLLPSGEVETHIADTGLSLEDCEARVRKAFVEGQDQVVAECQPEHKA